MADRLIDRVLDPQYVSGLTEVSDEELARRIEDASEIERQVSAQRRALHRIIDDELARRIEDASEIERQVSAQRRALHRIIDELQTELSQRSAS